MSDQARKTTILGPDCQMKGELILDNDAIIMGRFSGNLNVTGVLEIAETAEIKGQIVAGMLRLAGRAEASVVAEGGVEMMPGAELIGQIYTSNLQVVEGAIFQGDVFVGPDAAAAAQQQQQTQTQVGNARPARSLATARAPQLADEDDDAMEVDQNVQTMPGAVSNVLQRRRTKVIHGGGRPNEAA